MTWQPEGIMSVAHELIIAGMSDSVIVLDVQNRILELNPSARELIGHRASDMIGKPVAQIWADWSDQMEHPCAEREVSQEIVLGERDAQHTYDVRSSAIVDAQGQVAGRYAQRDGQRVARHQQSQAGDRITATSPEGPQTTKLAVGPSSGNRKIIASQP